MARFCAKLLLLGALALLPADAFLPTVLPGRSVLGGSRGAMAPALRAGAARLPLGPRQTGARAAHMLWSDGGAPGEGADFGTVPTYFPAVDRLVVTGDVHGDLAAIRACLDLAGLIDGNDDWCGGTTHFVQLGDILDREDDEKAVLDLLLKLQEQAKEASGAVHIVLGNHELMNAELDFRYVTEGAWDTWGTPTKGVSRLRYQMEALGYPEFMRDRIAAFRPGGEITARLAEMPVTIQVGDTLLVHGGIRRAHVDYGLEELNRATRRWLLDETSPKPPILSNGESPVWTRCFGAPRPGPDALEELSDVLGRVGATRMVVGHTPQLKGINAAVAEDGREVWRVDTGMSRGMMSGPRECLEVLADGRVHVLTEGGVVVGDMRRPQELEQTWDVCDLATGICTPQSWVEGEEQAGEDEEELATILWGESVKAAEVCAQGGSGKEDDIWL